ncbi:hypothetical protein D6C77_05203 [Aureobasidium pullulans]|nr:hypothetical protein D6C77_05203 [Aureobasidium pullulans]
MMLTNLLSFVVFLLSFTLLSRGAEYTTMDDLGYEYLAASYHTDSGIAAVVEDKGSIPSTTTSLFLENNMISDRRRGIRNGSKPGFRREDLKISFSDIDSAVKHIYDSFSSPEESAFPSTSTSSLFNSKNYVASLRADDKILPVAVEKQETGRHKS